MARSFLGRIDIVMRWLHLYTGLFLMPWMAIYATSAFCLNHQPKIMEWLDLPKAEWKMLRKVDLPDIESLPGEPGDKAKGILEHLDLMGPHRVLPGGTPQKMVILRQSGSGNYRVTCSNPRPSIRVEWFQKPQDGADGQKGHWKVMRNLPAPAADLLSGDEASQALAILEHAKFPPASHEVLANTPQQMVIMRNADAMEHRITWFHPEPGITVEQLQPFSKYRLMHALHFRGGYSQTYWPEITWAVMIDAVAASMWLWVLSGVYIWARRPKKRLLGAFVGIGGIVLFIVLVIQLCR